MWERSISQHIYTSLLTNKVAGTETRSTGQPPNELGFEAYRRPTHRFDPASASAQSTHKGQADNIAFRTSGKI